MLDFLVTSKTNMLLRGLRSKNYIGIVRSFVTSSSEISKNLDLKKYSDFELLGSKYDVDDYTNVTSRVLGKIGKQLHNVENHPINLVRKRIQNYFSSNYQKKSGNPLFTVFDNLSPVVTPHQSFDSLLFHDNHPGKSCVDTYYINSKHLLRPHMTAHDEDLIKRGFNTFLSVGDVYRRDQIDRTHFPVFHQMDGVRLFAEDELFEGVRGNEDMKMFETGNRTIDKQEDHTVDASKFIEIKLKQALLGVVQKLFGKDIQHRWVDCEFPFTHPSWELEIFFNEAWLEVLGCGVLEQKILTNAGITNKAGWAFGVGLDRLAMVQYQIPDIRLLWSRDNRFHEQFVTDDPEKKIVYQPISKFINRTLDLSFWVPESFAPNDFHDLVGSIGGEVVENVHQKEKYVNAKNNRTSYCYSITYGYMEKELTLEEANNIHNSIASLAAEQLGVKIR